MRSQESRSFRSGSNQRSLAIELSGFLETCPARSRETQQSRWHPPCSGQAAPLRMPRAGMLPPTPETVKSGTPPCVGVLRCRAAQQREHDRQTNPPSARIYLDFLLPRYLDFFLARCASQEAPPTAGRGREVRGWGSECRKQEPQRPGSLGFLQTRKAESFQTERGGWCVRT